jgi:hypothetical protein
MHFILFHLEFEDRLLISVFENRLKFTVENRKVSKKVNWRLLWILNPDFASRTSILPIHYFCSFFPSSLLFWFPLPLSLLHDDKRTIERANERTNGNSPFLTHVHLLLTSINFLPFASLLLLLAQDRLRR